MTQGAHTLQLNLRHDRDSEFGSHSTGGVAYGYAFAPGWRVTAAMGTAFRVPTLYQRFSEYGQPALQPEKSRNVELGLHWSQGASRVGVTAYRNKVRNLITFGAAGPCGSAFGCYENTGRAVLQGLTISAAHRLAGINLGARWTCRIEGRHQRQAAGAPRKAHPEAERRHPCGCRRRGLTLGAEWLASSRRFDNAANTHVLAGYGIVNLYASTTIAREWNLLARVDNVGDRDYQIARGYATGGRRFFVGLRWTPR